MDDDLSPFESPRLYVESAKIHASDFEASIAAFKNGCSHEIFKKTDPNSGEQILCGRAMQRLPPIARKHVSDTVNDLRHALDQAVCDAAIMTRRTNPKGVYFPFARSKAEFPAQLADKCRNVHGELLAFLSALDPYYGGDSLLWALTRLAAKKHQRIITIAPRFRGLGVKPDETGVVNFSFEEIFLHNAVNFRNEFEFARLTPGRPFNANLGFAFDIVFGAVDVVSGQEVSPYLADMIRKVSGIIDGLEAEAARIKSGNP